MRTLKIITITVLIFLALAGVYYEITSDSTLVTHPKGLIAHEELKLIELNLGLMLLIIFPTFVWLLITAWRYQDRRSKGKLDPENPPEKSSGKTAQVLCWVIPSCLVAVMTVVMWNAAHDLDPSVPIASDKKPLNIQVVALDWKWLFIYPEQNIASLNFVQYPEKTPVIFTLTGDDAPMNSFWLPQMCGQLYAMTGMANTLHLIADGPGEYKGRAVEINGDGYGDMTFTAKSSTQADFDAFVKEAKISKFHLTDDALSRLEKHEIEPNIILYGAVEKDLFEKILMKYMEHSAKP